MKYFILLFLVFCIVSCQSVKYSLNSLNNPPSVYKPYKMYTKRDLLKEYQRSLIKISEWQKWYNVQISSNYFNINK